MQTKTIPAAERISIRDLAAEISLHHVNVRRGLKRLGIAIVKMRSGAGHEIDVVSRQDADAFIDDRRRNTYVPSRRTDARSR
jgi:hypothetical protein